MVLQHSKKLLKMPSIKYPKIDFAKLQKKYPIDEIHEDQIIFFDLETDDKYAPYAKLNTIGIKYGFDGPCIDVKTRKQNDKFRETMANTDIIKVGFNSKNFDEIILKKEGYELAMENAHDGYLMIKAIAALMPSYSLKFLMWFLLGDHHFAEGKVEKFLTQTRTKDYSLIPPHLLHPYHMHDLDQHRDIFRLAWEEVQTEPHWSAYNLDLAASQGFQEMILDGGLDINLQLCKTKIVQLERERDEINERVREQTGGCIENVNSTKQVAPFLDIEGLEMALTEDGEWSIKKGDLMDLRSKHPIAQDMYRVREINGTVKYFKAYDRAITEGRSIEIEPGIFRIPRSYSISNARTRRPTSSSRFGINFQNSSEEAKTVHKVPDGELGVWIDATQIENVVHIYESEDNARRLAYEADEEWSEYVWLCNEILGGIPRSKSVLDSIPSNVNSNWSIYKQYKTAKLALNFGQGAKGHSKTTGLPLSAAYESFDKIHEACPAIRNLQTKVGRRLRQFGFVEDVFGHIYSGPERKAYKVVAYLIQGCGTGSYPKAFIFANLQTLRRRQTGLMVGTTHDDVYMRLNLRKGVDNCLATLHELYYNMTKRFSPKFDNIPLRAKMYLSRTYEPTGKAKIEINLKDPSTYEHYLS